MQTNPTKGGVVDGIACGSGEEKGEGLQESDQVRKYKEVGGLCCATDATRAKRAIIPGPSVIINHHHDWSDYPTMDC